MVGTLRHSHTCVCKGEHAAGGLQHKLSGADLCDGDVKDLYITPPPPSPGTGGLE